MEEAEVAVLEEMPEVEVAMLRQVTEVGAVEKTEEMPVEAGVAAEVKLLAAVHPSSWRKYRHPARMLIDRYCCCYP